MASGPTGSILRPKGLRTLPDTPTTGVPITRHTVRVYRGKARAAAMAELAIRTDFLIRVLTSANEKMETDLGPAIEALKAECTKAGSAERARRGAEELA